jgi:hypothetical protein
MHAGIRVFNVSTGQEISLETALVTTTAEGCT